MYIIVSIWTTDLHRFIWEDDFGSADRGSNLGLLNLSDSTVNTEGGDLRCRAGFGERSQH